METVDYKNLKFTIWDVGGQHKIRTLWHHYYGDAEAVIFVIDSVDVQRFEEAREELQVFKSNLNDHIKSTVKI